MNGVNTASRPQMNFSIGVFRENCAGEQVPEYRLSGCDCRIKAETSAERFWSLGSGAGKEKEASEHGWYRGTIRPIAFVLWGFFCIIRKASLLRRRGNAYEKAAYAAE